MKDKYQEALDKLCNRCFGDEPKKTLQELVDKETPQKVLCRTYELQSDPYDVEITCPHCGGLLYEGDLEECYKFGYCCYCGGKLDWSGE